MTLTAYVTKPRGQYKSYTDLVPDEWTHLRIEVSGANAQFYVNGAAHPTLIVRDLRHGADAHGTVGLWQGPERTVIFVTCRSAPGGERTAAHTEI